MLTKPTRAVHATHPRYTDASANPQCAGTRRLARCGDNFADDLMARNQLLLESWQVAFHDMQIGSTNTASQDAKQDLVLARYGARDVPQLEKRSLRPSGR